MENEKIDLRIVKTKKVLYTTLIELMKEMPFEEIKVSDICSRALVNRSTFYSHYSDKYDLLSDCVKAIKNSLAKELSKNEKITTARDYYLKMISIFIDHIEENKEIYKLIVVNNKNSVTVVEMNEIDGIKQDFIPLKPKHEMIEIKGSYNEVSGKAFYENLNNETDYFRITLTDEQDVLDALGKLRSIYHNILRLDYDNKRTRENKTVLADENAREKTPYELFSEFYEKQNNEKLNETQEKYINQLITKEMEEQN